MPLLKEGKETSSPTKPLTDGLTHMYSDPWYRQPPSCEHSPQHSATESVGLKREPDKLPAPSHSQALQPHCHCFWGVQALLNPLSPGLLCVPCFQESSHLCPLPQSHCIWPHDPNSYHIRKRSHLLPDESPGLGHPISDSPSLADRGPGQASHRRRRSRRRKKGKCCPFLLGHHETLESNHHQSI